MSEDGGAAAVPVRRFEVETNTVAETVEAVRSIYVDADLKIARSPTTACRFAVRSVSVGDLAMDSTQAPMRTFAAGRPMDYLCFVATARGRFDVIAGREEVRTGPDDVMLYPVGKPFSSVWHGFEVRALRLPLDAVARVAATRTGIAAADFRFDAMTSVSPGAARFFRDTLGYLYRELHGPDSALANPLVYTAAIDMAAAAALVTFPNTATTVTYLPCPAWVAPAVVRRAVAFIEACAAEPLTVARIAAEVGVTPRGLQAAFRRHLDTTPTAHLRQVRLHRARTDLQAADPTTGDTVAAVARRWGFAHPGRFTAAYHAAFGCSPSHTLRT